MKVIVTDREGREHVLEALEGWRVMEVIRDWGVPIKAECGGAGICGTCHVHVDSDWTDVLPEPDDEELDALDKLGDADENSRLCCQILMSDGLDGLRVTLSEDTAANAEDAAANAEDAAEAA